MRTVAPLAVGAAAASQLPEQKNGGWLDIYQDGGENLPELNSKIDIANFYKNPLSEKYGIYQDPTDKGYKYYHRYTDAQIESVKNLLLYWRDTYGINLTYNETDMWSVSKRALSGDNGVYTHNSYRKDKTDIHPCPRMIAMLKSL